MIKLSHVQTYSGPNIYSSEPSIVVSCEIEKEVLKTAHKHITLIKQRLSGWFLYPDIEHINDLELANFFTALALSLLNEVRGSINLATTTSKDNKILLILGYHKSEVSFLALKIAVNLYVNIEKLNPTDLQKILSDFWNICRNFHPDFQASILIETAREKNIPVLSFINGTKFWQYGWGAQSRIFMESLSNTDGSIANILSKDKLLTKSVFKSIGIPIPKDVAINSLHEIESAIKTIGYPCVVKPVNGGGGKGVTANIKNYNQLVQAFNYARQVTKDTLLIEQFIHGNDYRIMVIDGKFVAAIQREPSYIIGDGKNPIRELIKQLNNSRSLNLRKSNYLRPIAIDNILIEHLAKQKVNLETILNPQQYISLRSNANLSTGGICTDFTSKTHPSIQTLVEQLALTLGFGSVGFDYITTDITLTYQKSGGVFIEMNTTPGIDVTIAAGWSFDKIGTIILGNNISRIPIILNIYTSQQDIPKLSSYTDYHSAKVYNNTISLGNVFYKIENNKPWGALQSALRNKAVQSVEIFCTLSDIIQHGMPVDYVDSINISNTDIPLDWLDVLKKHSSKIKYL